MEKLLVGKDRQKVSSSDGLLDKLKKALAERILSAKMDQHLAAKRAEKACATLAIIIMDTAARRCSPDRQAGIACGA